MSAGEQQQAANSFGDPNAQPPTPSTGYTSPQTPKQQHLQLHLESSSSGWTPHFAEEYSVFNATPGNLKGSSSQTVGTGSSSALALALDLDFAPPSQPSASSAGKKRRLSGADVTAHLGVSPIPQPTATARAAPPRSAKKSRAGSSSSGASISPVAIAKSSPILQRQTQTATPPPSSRGGRKLAPKPQIDSSTMQQQQNQRGGFPQPDFSSSAQQQQQHQHQQQQAPPPPLSQLNTSFMSGHHPNDVFGYAMGGGGSGSAPPLTGPRTFWGFDMGTSGMDTSGLAMDVDLSGGADLFQPPIQTQQSQQQQQRPMSSLEWGRTQFQQQTMPSGAAQQPESSQQQKQQQQQQQQQQDGHNPFQMSMGDPFGAGTGGVDPGMLFSQPMHSSMMPALSMSMDTSVSRPAVSQGQSQLRHKQLAPAISPIKATSQTGRPSLSRSFSESARGGKRTVGGGRTSLPALAPARPVTIHQASLPTPAPAQGPKTNSGRSSPLKSSHHHRLSSLSSIPENARSRSARRTSVKFVIDENGRARAETTIADADPSLHPFPSSQRSSSASSHRNSWAGPFSVPAPPAVRTPGNDNDDDHDEYSSSEDEEPIIIPSRNTSFAYPDPPLPPKSSGSGASSRPATAASSGIFSHHRAAVALDKQTANAPTNRPSTGSSLGDAAAELRKVMQAAHPLRRTASGGGQHQHQPQPPGSGPSTGHRARFTPGQRSSSSTISEASLPAISPPHLREQAAGGGGGGGQVRCVCNRPEAGDGVFMVKCDSCDFLLHGRCVDMPAREDVPNVVICAFCANTPNMRGGRMRYTGRSNTAGGGQQKITSSSAASAAAAAAAAVASSPLAHKSFRSFR